eukprot:7704925-Ditylum_brightwellii.AAC.1
MSEIRKVVLYMLTFSDAIPRARPSNKSEQISWENENTAVAVELEKKVHSFLCDHFDSKRKNKLKLAVTSFLNYTKKLIDEGKHSLKLPSAMPRDYDLLQNSKSLKNEAIFSGCIMEDV